MSRATVVTPENISLEACGRTNYVCRISGSDTTGARVEELLPVVVINARESGPTLLLTGGVHGNEYEGPLALTALACDADLSIARGRLIIAPSVNPSALRARRRRSPADELDLNRSFPGRPHAEITRAIAHFLGSVLGPLADVVVDLHAGGEDSCIVPSVMLHFLDNPVEMRRAFELGIAMGLPAVLIIDERNLGLFDTHIEHMGKPFLCCELGGAGMVNAETLRYADEGIRRILAAVGLTDANSHLANFRPWRHWDRPRVLSTPDERRLPCAQQAGLFRPALEIGESVEPGQAIGCIHSAVEFWRPAQTVVTSVGGIVYSRHTGAWVSEGETLAIIGTDVTEPDPLAAIMATTPASRAPVGARNR